MKNSALVLIDIQRGFSDQNWWGIRNNLQFEENVVKAVSYWREQKLPIIHVQHISKVKKSPLRPGQDGVDFMPCAKPLDGESIVQKSVNSAFIGTKFQDLLEKKNIHHLVMAGLTADHCVSTTARMASNLGFEVTILADATACFPRKDLNGNFITANDVQRISLASLNGEFGSVKNFESYVSERSLSTCSKNSDTRL